MDRDNEKEIIQDEVEVQVEVATQSEATESDAEEPAEGAAPFDENQLLEFAKNEGLADELPQEVETEGPSTIDLSEAEQAEISSAMESILFMSDKPVSLPKLRSVIRPDVPISAYRVLMNSLREEFNQDHRGVEIAEVSLGFQLRTKPHMASVLRKLVKTQPLKISPASMEVLSIVAYKQPVTKDELDRIRGVDCGYVLRMLMEKRLIRISGRSDLPGRPMLYGTTHEFLELFSLRDIKALPPLHEVEAMIAQSEVGAEEEKAAAFEQFSKMVAGSDKILFDDSQLDTELEAIRAEINSISTSTPFIEEQKARDRLEARIAELAAEGKTIDMDGVIVAVGSIPALSVDQLLGKQPLSEEIVAALAAVKLAREQTALAAAEAVVAAAEGAEAEPAASAAPAAPKLQTEPALEHARRAAAKAAALAEPQGEIEIEAEGEAATEVVAEATVEAQPTVEQSIEAELAAEESEAAPVITEHAPSTELEAAAAAAQWERHAEMIAEALAESKSVESGADSLAEAIEEAKEANSAAELGDDKEPEQSL